MITYGAWSCAGASVDVGCESDAEKEEYVLSERSSLVMIDIRLRKS
jgi:hypothetical protein